VSGERWLTAPLTSATTWAFSWTPDSAFVNSGRAITVRAKSRDAYGHDSIIASVASNARVKASLTRPTRSSYTLKRSTSYRFTGYLKPRHTSGTYPVKIKVYRYKDGKYSYYKTFSAKASNYTSSTGAKSSKYTGYVKLPYKGKWRMRAYHTDNPHLPTYSSYRYVTVR